MRFPLRTIAAIALAAPPTAGSHHGAITDAQAVRNGSTITVTWIATGPVDLLMSGDPSASPGDMREIVDDDLSGRHTVVDTHGLTRPYFYLRPESGEGRRVAVRVLPLEGGRNFRDLGGYPTADGRHVRWGQVFRSGVMTHLTDSDYEYLSALGIRVVCDFRTADERDSEPTEWRARPDITYLTWDDPPTGRGGLRELLQQPQLTPEDVQEMMLDNYRGGIAQHLAAYREMFDRLANGEVPLAFNCSGGKDRAGRAAALLLTALGVPREIVVADYVLTDRIYDVQQALVPTETGAGTGSILQRLPAELLAPLMRSDPKYMEAMFDYLDEQYGGVHAFIRKELDVDDFELARIRTALLE